AGVTIRAAAAARSLAVACPPNLAAISAVSSARSLALRCSLRLRAFVSPSPLATPFPPRFFPVRSTRPRSSRPRSSRPRSPRPCSPTLRCSSLRHSSLGCSTTPLSSLARALRVDVLAGSFSGAAVQRPLGAAQDWESVARGACGGWWSDFVEKGDGVTGGAQKDAAIMGAAIMGAGR
ncbi:unnamed protein product, partial [Closterium sp. Naga37s-1]